MPDRPSLYLFCGDSHARQLRTERPGAFTHAIFSGASIKGLVNEQPDKVHGQVIRHYARAPVIKALFLMFGSVDVDFSFYRKLALEGLFDVDAWIDERVDAYNRFISDLIQASPEGDGFSTITVLAPQPSPLDDANFFKIMPAHTKVSEGEFRASEAHSDLGRVARNRRTVYFNDRLEAGLMKHPWVKLYRIDRDMLDADGKFIERFVPELPDEHHANTVETRQLWFRLLKTDVPTLAFMIDSI